MHERSDERAPRGSRPGIGAADQYPVALAAKGVDDVLIDCLVGEVLSAKLGAHGLGGGHFGLVRILPVKVLKVDKTRKVPVGWGVWRPRNCR